MTVVKLLKIGLRPSCLLQWCNSSDLSPVYLVLGFILQDAYNTFKAVFE